MFALLLSVVSLLSANADEFTESRLALVKVVNVGEKELFLVFQNKDGLFRWSVVEKTFKVSDEAGVSKW